MKSILILRGGALGDFLVTLPLLKALRSRWPEARIELVGNQTAAELAVLDGSLHATHGQAEARWAQLYTTKPLADAFRSWLETFDLVLSYWVDPDNDLGKHLPLRPGQLFRSNSATITRQPASTHFFQPLQEWSVDPLPQETRLTLPGAVQAEADARLPLHPRRIAMHPGSGSSHKNWPLDRWIELIATVAPDPVLVILGESEATLKAQLVRLDPSRIQVADQWRLPLLAGAIKRCRIFIGHDTGISHLAAAVGTPCLLLFGPTEPAIWAPQGRHVEVLRKGRTVDTITLEDVRARMPWVQ